MRASKDSIAGAIRSQNRILAVCCILLLLIQDTFSSFLIKYLVQLPDSTALCTTNSGVYFVGGWIRSTGTKDVKIYTLPTPSNNAGLVQFDLTSNPSYGTDCLGDNKWAYIMKAFTGGPPCAQQKFFITGFSLAEKKTCGGSLYEFEEYFGTSSKNPNAFSTGGLKSDLRYHNAIYAYGSTLSSASSTDTLTFALELSFPLSSAAFSLSLPAYSTAFEQPSTYQQYTAASPTTTYPLTSTSVGATAYWDRGVVVSAGSGVSVKTALGRTVVAAGVGRSVGVIVVVQAGVAVGTSTVSSVTVTDNTNSNIKFEHILTLTTDGTTTTVKQSFTVDDATADTFTGSVTHPFNGGTNEYVIVLSFWAADNATKALARSAVACTTSTLSGLLHNTYSSGKYNFSNDGVSVAVQLTSGTAGFVVRDAAVGSGFFLGYPWAPAGSYKVALGMAEPVAGGGFSTFWGIRCAVGSWYNPVTSACVSCPTGCAECEGRKDVAICIKCSTGKYLNVQKSTCLDTCTAASGVFMSDTEPKICSNCYIPYCKKCEKIHTCSEYFSATEMGRSEYQIVYPEKKISIRFDRVLNFSNPADYLTIEFSDKNFTSTTTNETQLKILNSIRYSFQGKDLVIKFTYPDHINCNTTILKLKSEANPIRFYSSGQFSMFSTQYTIPNSNFLNPTVSTYTDLGKILNISLRVMLIITILILSPAIDSYFTILSYGYLFRLFNQVYPSSAHAFLDAFLEDLNWPLGNYIAYVIPSTECSSLPLKVKQSYFDCIGVRNLQTFLILLVYLGFVKFIVMGLRLITRNSKEGLFFRVIKIADQRVSKVYLVKYFGSSLLFFSLFSCLGVYNDIVNWGNDKLDIHAFVLNCLLAVTTVGVLTWIGLMTRKTFKVMVGTEEEQKTGIHSSLFLQSLALEYKKEGLAYGFFFGKHLKLFLLGGASYGLYSFSLIQVAILSGIELIYFLSFVIIRPFYSYLRLMIQFLVDLLVLLLMILALVFHPDLDLLSYPNFEIAGRAFTVMLILLFGYVTLMIVLDLVVIIREWWKHYKANRKVSPPKPVEKVDLFLPRNQNLCQNPRLRRLKKNPNRRREN